MQRREVGAICRVAALLVAVGCAAGSDTSTKIAPSTAPPGAEPTVTSVAADARQGLLDHTRESYGAPGALAVVRDDDDEWNLMSGAADLAGAKLTDSTRFRVASITKPIVAALVLDAVVREELALDDTVSELVPGVLGADQPITVRMLLNHTSGVFNAGDEGDIVADIDKLTDPALREEALALASRYVAGERVIASDRLWVALAETHERYFEPGAGYHYSNVNYHLAAMVLEAVTGTPLAVLLQERLVDPLGLRRTTLAPADSATPELHGYTTGAADGPLVDITDDLLALGNGGSGGVISTADELLTVMQAIVSGRLLPAPLVAEMSRATQQSGESYGLGLVTYYLSCGTFFGHEGSIAGTVSIAIVTPDGDGGVVIALNRRDDSDPHLPALADSFLCARS
jgi:D-alanyl-D-alanine carboxypeptidase